MKLRWWPCLKALLRYDGTAVVGYAVVGSAVTALRWRPHHVGTAVVGFAGDDPVAMALP